MAFTKLNHIAHQAQNLKKCIDQLERLRNSICECVWMHMMEAWIKSLI